MALDQSVFVPLQTVCTLVFNALTGLCVWEDWKVIDRWASYATLHVIMLLAVYQIGSLDLLDSVRVRRAMRSTKLSAASAPTPFGRAILSVIDEWTQQRGALGDTQANRTQKEAADRRKETARKICVTLDEGVSSGRLSASELADLSKRLLSNEAVDVGPSGALIGWLRTCHVYALYVRIDPAFGRMLDVLEGKPPAPAGGRVGGTYIV